MKDYEAMAENVFRRRDEYIKIKKRRNRNIISAAAALSCVCIIIAGAWRTSEDINDTEVLSIGADTSSGSVKTEYKAKEEKKNTVEDLSSPMENRIEINRIDEMMSTALDIDCQIEHDVNPQDFKLNTGVEYDRFMDALPKSFVLENIYSLKTPKTPKTGEYIHHDYVLNLRTTTDGSADIAMCAYEKPLRDWLMMCDEPKISQINGIEMVIQAYENMYMTVFQCGNMYYDITSQNITEDDFISLLSSVTSVRGEDVPADADGFYMETIDIDDSEYYGGSYINDARQFVIVLTEDTPENRTEICAKLGQSEDSVVFEKGKYTLDYLTKLQERISGEMISRELPFVTTSALRESKNRIVVTVTTEDKSEWDKIYALDTIGGAIDVVYSENTARTEELIEYK